jgi:CheY-like chemotaxis protein
MQVRQRGHVARGLSGKRSPRFAEVVDIRTPELDGLEATRRLLAGGSGPRVLILTTFDADEYLYEAMKAGASHSDPLGSRRTRGSGQNLSSSAAPGLSMGLGRGFRCIAQEVSPPRQVDADPCLAGTSGSWDRRRCRNERQARAAHVVPMGTRRRSAPC